MTTSSASREKGEGAVLMDKKRKVGEEDKAGKKRKQRGTHDWVGSDVIHATDARLGLSAG